jgi:hypothetical protein
MGFGIASYKLSGLVESRRKGIWIWVVDYLNGVIIELWKEKKI